VCTETARGVDEHLFIRPGTDALFVLAIANTLFTEGRVTLAPHVAGLDELPGLIEPFTPEAVAPITGIAEDDIRRLARELSDAPSGSVYDRVGAHQQEFGTLTSWGCDVGQPTDRQPRPSRWADVPARGARHTGPGAGARPGLAPVDPYVNETTWHAM
jgi:hypothetical protein